jgi:carbohydrate kinase (thermoresistant glucokinase family)
MGASGSGKSVIGGALAEALGGVFVDADDLHSDEARAKMSSGAPLTDEDRAPWLVRVGERLVAESDAGRRPVIACSALRRRYRDTIRSVVGGDVVFVLLDGPAELIAKRLAARSGHFMPAVLLDSQLAALERLEPDENGLVVSIAAPPEAIVDRISHEVRKCNGGVSE